jgi:hypothetical protein
MTQDMHTNTSRAQVHMHSNTATAAPHYDEARHVKRLWISPLLGSHRPRRKLHSERLRSRGISKATPCSFLVW